MDEIQNVLMNLAEKYPDQEIQNLRNFERLVMVDSNTPVEPQEAGTIMRNFNQIAAKLIQINCIKQDN